MPEIEVEARPITWAREGRLKDRPLYLCAHGAGAPYTSPFMLGTAKRLAKRGITVIRFHFPYMEASVREGRKRGPDPARRLMATWRAMLARTTKMRGHGPLFIGGKSMGGRMASMLLADGVEHDVRGAIYLGYPLHPPGQPAKLRAAHLTEVGVPQLFVQGERDKLCDPKLLRRTLKKVQHATHYQVAGADHSLARSRKDPMRDADEWLDVVSEFVATHGR